MNSVRENCYKAYFRPRSYQFSDVLKSIETAKQHGKFVAVNYLNCPGFTDSKKEFTALKNFIKTYQIDMIQWRNLNFDPKKYCEMMLKIEDSGQPLGMETIIEQLKILCPELIHGYFNPPKSLYQRE
jgi:pyruvate-formate lyase-activating enzyme